MVRELAAFDFDAAQRIAGWPVREGLIAYVALMRDQTVDVHRHRELIWQIGAPHRKKGSKGSAPPAVPPLLKHPRIDE